jgi:predicted transcriptional regulator
MFSTVYDYVRFNFYMGFLLSSLVIQSAPKQVFRGFGVERKSIVRKRGWAEITVDILAATLNPEKKTRIMYKANLNYDRFNQYFNDFLRKGFIFETDDYVGNTAYKISERGKTLLAVLRKAEELADFEE